VKKKDFKKSIEFLFPDEASKIIAIIIIFVVLILSIVFTFVIVKNLKKGITQNIDSKINNSELKKIELLEPKINFELNYDLTLYSKKQKIIEKKDFDNLFHYKEFGEYTNFILEFSIYKKYVQNFLSK